MADRPIQFDVQKHLSGVDYPASRDDLVSTAERENAPQEVLDALKNLPDRSFESPVQVTEAINQ
jgi:hypothetical protein